MNDLLPCPFCGGEAQRDDTYAPKMFYGCPEAKCDVWVLSLDAWNRRAAHEQIARVQLQLEDATDDVASLSVERSDLADEVKTLRYEIAKVRAETIEEAAKTCEDWAEGRSIGTRRDMAAAEMLRDLAASIRALQEKAK